MVIRDIDDYIIDHMAQPIADWLTDLTGYSCYRVSNLLMIVSGAITMFDIKYRLHVASIVGIIVWLIIIEIVLRMNNKEEAKEFNNAQPRQRLYFLSGRVVICLFVWLLIVRVAASSITTTTLLDATWSTSALIGLYFAACVGKCPTQKRKQSLAFNGV